ncbi:MAG: serine protease [Rhodospirillales bacterium]|nr:serine protease [Rhodospirillales bacterium]
MPQSREQVQLSFAPVVKRTAPAVVNVFSRRTVRSAASPLTQDPLFRRFFGENSPFVAPTERVQRSLGSGVIVAADGTIVTNHHVIKDADEITIVLADRREFEARVLRSDERVDLAVLKIDMHGERLPFLELRDSDELEVGDMVLAIGNPFGVGQTVTSGIVSALARTGVGVSDFRFFIQTDAAINPGNSGGALVSLDGRLVGINTAIFSQSGGSVGLGFAIPSLMVRTVLAGAGSGGKIVRPWLGAAGQPVTAELAQSLALPRPMGVLIKSVAPNSPAARAGLRAGEVVQSINGHEVEDEEALRFRVATLPVGSTARLAVFRNGTSREVETVLTAPPEDPPRSTTDLAGSHPFAGARVANLSPALADEIGMDAAARGVVILAVDRRSPAARLGFSDGDIIAGVNGKAVTSVAQLRELLDQRPRQWQLQIRRRDKLLSLTVGA